MNVKINVELVTPEMAAKWLAESKAFIESTDGLKNRRINATVVNQYATCMSNGEWQENGETIKFDNEGILVDGQNRLSAVVKSGVAVEFVVIRGIDRSTILTIDIGMKRTIEQGLQFICNCYERGAAAVVKLVMVLKKGNKTTDGGQTCFTFSPTDMVDEYADNEANYNEATIIGKRYHTNSSKSITPTEGGGIYYYLVNCMYQPKDLVEQFFYNLCSVRLNDKSIYSDTINNLRNKKTCRGSDRLNEYIRCWNGMVLGRTSRRPLISEHNWFITSKRN